MLLDLENTEKELLVKLLTEALEDWQYYSTIRHAHQPENWEERREAARVYQEILHKLD